MVWPGLTLFQQMHSLNCLVCCLPGLVRLFVLAYHCRLILLAVSVSSDTIFVFRKYVGNCLDDARLNPSCACFVKLLLSFLIEHYLLLYYLNLNFVNFLCQQNLRSFICLILHYHHYFLRYLLGYENLCYNFEEFVQIA